MQYLVAPFVTLLCAGALALQLTTANPQDGNETSQPLQLLALVPYPNPRDPKSETYAGAPAYSVIPAIRLAVKHINARPDVLSGYTLRLREGDSGCRAPAFNVLLNFTEHIIHRRNEYKVAAIVGPACSSPTATVGLLAARSDGINLLQIASATSPGLSRKKFANTFRSVSSTLVFVNVFSRLIEKRQWNRVATLYEGAPFYISIHRPFADTQHSESRLVFSSVMYEWYLPVKELKANRVRIVFVFASAGLAKKLLCYSYHLKFTYPVVQWFFRGKDPAGIVGSVTFSYDGKHYSCSEQEMRKAAEGAVLCIYKLERLDRSTNDTVSGISFNSYRTQYETENLKFIGELPNIVSTVHKDTPRSNVYYDAVWALALAMNNSLPMLNDKGYNLSEYDYSQKEATDIIRKELFQLEFEGMSGFIKFNESTRDNIGTPIDIMQIPPLQSGSGEELAVHIGYYQSTVENGSLQLETISLFIDDDFDKDFIELPVSVGSVLLTFSLLFLLMTLLLHITNTLLYRHRSVRATSTGLNHLIFSGCYLFLFAACTYIILDSFLVSQLVEVSELVFIVYSVACNMFYWSIFIGYSLIFGTVFVKTWRIYSLFKSFRRLNNILIRDESLVIYVLIQVVVDISVLTAWNLRSPWLLHQEEYVRGNDAVIDITLSCRTDQIFFVAILLVYKVIQTVPVLVFAVLTRRIHKQEFKVTKSVSVLVYLLVFLCGLGALCYVALLNVRLGQQLVIFVGLTMFVVLCDVFLFIPPIVPVIRKKKGFNFVTQHSFRSLN